MIKVVTIDYRYSAFRSKAKCLYWIRCL